MTTYAASLPHNFRSVPVIAGGALVGTLDLVFACTWWALAADVAPVRIFQSIAAGLLGQASFAGGLRSAALGGVLHYAIATAMVCGYTLAATRVPVLVRRPLRWGGVYGLFLYALMTYVVVPLSAAGGGAHDPAWILASIAMHGLIGVLCAFCARRALR